jgi:4'-phosphopantetheinyl transferase
VLADYLAISPAALQLATAPGGKPLLPQYPWLQFNLSHSGQWAAIALCRDRAVGVDIECVAGQVSTKRAVAQRFFHPRDQSWLAQEPQQFLLHFTQLWSLKEAWLKAQGTGLAGSLASFFITPAAEGMAEVGYEEIPCTARLHYQVLPTAPAYVLAFGGGDYHADPDLSWQVCMDMRCHEQRDFDTLLP